ncbi:MAG: glycosyltransferase family 4 protein [Pseudomonadota bacterium]
MSETHRKIAYVMNTYPITSTTFITGEIRALEALGINVLRFASKPWDVDLTSDVDKTEKTKTKYLLYRNFIPLLLTLIATALRSPRSLCAAVWETFRLTREAQKSIIHHIGYFLQALYLAKECRQNQIDHLHAHFGTNATSICLIASHVAEITYSFTVHGPDEFDTVSPAEYRRKVARAEKVFAISHYCRGVLMRKVGFEARDKLEIVRCGVDLEAFAAAAAPASASDSNIFTCVGRLCPQKAQVLILEALELLLAKGIDAKIVFIGDGELRDAVESQIQAHGLSNNVELRGWQNPDQIRDAIRQSRAFLLPSLAEGLPVSIMEAYAMGKPVISTYIAGIPELVDDKAGWIIPSGNSADIANAMAACLSTSLSNLGSMGETGQTRVRERHDIQKQARRIKQLLTL